MEEYKRWCSRCFENTPTKILDSDRIMVGKKSRFLHKCLVCGKVSRLPMLRGMAECTY